MKYGANAADVSVDFRVWQLLWKCSARPLVQSDIMELGTGQSEPGTHAMMEASHAASQL